MKYARKIDMLIIVILAVLGILIWVIFNNAFSRSGTVAEIYHKSQLVKTVDLSTGKDESFSIEGLPGVVFHQYSDGSIAFAESDCQDKICVESGHLHLAGQIAACLPNQVYVKIIGTEKANPDAPDIMIG